MEQFDPLITQVIGVFEPDLLRVVHCLGTEKQVSRIRNTIGLSVQSG